MNDTDDMVNHPPHYQNHPSGIECIEITELLPANLANAFKYVFRAGNKTNTKEDLEKAIWYLDRFDTMSPYIKDMQKSISPTIEQILLRDMRRIVLHEDDQLKISAMECIVGIVTGSMAGPSQAISVINRMIKEIPFLGD